MKRINSWLLLCLLVLTVRAGADSFEIADIRIEGLQRISAGSIFSVLPINIGDTTDAQMLRNTARAMFATGNFNDIKLARDGDVLVIQVVERPSISEINLEGNKAIETEALVDGLKGAGLAEGQVLKRSTLEGMRLELQRQYVGQGRYDATIEAEVVEQPRNRVGVNILINEGNVAKIKHINVVGNEAFSEGELRGLFELDTTGTLSFITGDDKYSKEKLKGDLEKLESWYLDRGYIKFNIESTQVSITPDRKAVYITVNVAEGEQYTVRDVELSGDLVLDQEVLKRFVLVQKGQMYSQILVTQSEDYISKRLGNDGYTFAKISGIPDVDDEDKSVGLKFFIDPGKRTYVRRIQFRGNTRTRDEVLRREMRQMESATASNSKVEQGRIRLQRLGYFKTVDVETPEVPGVDDQIDVNYTVEEQPSGSIGASVGFAQGTGLILGGNIQQNNFLGTGKRVGIGINISAFQRSANFSYVNPYYTEDGVSRGFSVFYRQTNLDEVNVASYSTDVYGASMNFGYPLSETQRLGFSLGAQRTNITTGRGAVQEIKASPRPIEGVTEVIDGFDELSNSNTSRPLDPASDFFPRGDLPLGFLDRYGDAFNTFTLTSSWSQSTLNRGQLATRGASQSVALELAVPGSDVQFYKLSYNGQIFVPITRSWTLRFRGELGYGDGYGDTDVLPFFENFFAGGFGSVRGFKTNTLGPRATPASQYASAFPQTGVDANGNPVFNFPLSYIENLEGCQPLPFSAPELVDGKLSCSPVFINDFSPFGGNVLIEGGVELLFPLPFIKDQNSMRTAFFIDVGNVFSTDCGPYQPGCLNVNVADLRYSFGVGLTWITGFGPLSFSLAKPFQEGEFDDVEIFQFSLGQVF
jgi:outer membrane protein insertion porin family